MKKYKFILLALLLSGCDFTLPATSNVSSINAESIKVSESSKVSEESVISSKVDSSITNSSSSKESSIIDDNSSSSSSSQKESTPIHDHTFEEEWTYDENKHWHKSTCGHNVKSEEDNHSLMYGICQICGYDSIHLEYRLLDDDTYEVISKGTDLSSYIIIPSSYNGKSVTSIGEGAFSYEYDLLAIYIPSSITNIESQAFYYCRAALYLEVNEEPTTFRTNWHNYRPYYLGSNENTLLIKDGVHYHISNNEATVTRLISEEKVVTVESVIEINGNSYNVTKIGKYAFSYNKILEELSLGDNIKVIEKESFFETSKLRILKLPAALEEIQEFTFEYCEKIEKVYIDSVESWLKVKLNSTYSTPMYCGADIYIGDALLEEMVLPSDLEEIPAYQFMGWTSIKKVTIPASVKRIKAAAFDQCSNLKDIILETGSLIEELGGAFNGTAIESFVIPNTVTKLQGTFTNCKSLKTVTFESGINLETLGYYTFMGCSVLESIVIPSSVTFIDFCVFKDCKALTSLTYEAGINLTKIEYMAFAGCTALESIVIPLEVEFIGRYAFQYCSYTKLTVYCEASEKPEAWDANWDALGIDNKTANVVWGYQG